MKFYDCTYKSKSKPILVLDMGVMHYNTMPTCITISFRISINLMALIADGSQHKPLIAPLVQEVCNCLYAGPRF